MSDERPSRIALDGRDRREFNIPVAELFEKGVLLFNRRAYFESHEVWEQIWNIAEDREKKFLGALIQMAAGLHLRFERGGGRSTRNLLVQALATLEDYRPTHGGVDVESLYGELTIYAERVEKRKESEAGWLDRWLAPKIRLR
jgi:predicted metal-dependent hydrolase